MYDSDLYLHTFTEDELINSIDHLTVRRILYTQKNLSVHFVCNYILNPDHQFEDSDKSLDIDDVMFFQPHLKEHQDELIKQLRIVIKNTRYT
jgi:hypothetical protein